MLNEKKKYLISDEMAQKLLENNKSNKPKFNKILFFKYMK